MFLKLMISAALLFLLGVHPSFSLPKASETLAGLAQKNNLNPQDIERIVLLTLENNPEAFLSILQKSMEFRERQEMENQKKLISLHQKDLFQDTSSPSLGNPIGDITIVAFFDYQCGFCKKSEKVLRDLLKKDPLIRILYRDIPILGPSSQMLAKLALAAHLQGKYTALHTAFMESSKSLSESQALDLAQKCGIDKAKLQKDMDSSLVKDMVSNNLKLAETLQIQAAPFFIVNDKIIPGLLSAQDLQKTLDECRSQKKKTPPSL